MFYSFFPPFSDEILFRSGILHLEPGPILHNFIKIHTGLRPEPVFFRVRHDNAPGSIPVSLMYDTFHKPLKLFLPRSGKPSAGRGLRLLPPSDPVRNASACSAPPKTDEAPFHIPGLQA